MDDKRNPTYRSHSVHNYADFLFVSAGAEVKGMSSLPGEVKIRKNNWYHHRLNKGRNIWSAVRLRPPERGSRLY